MSRSGYSEDIDDQWAAIRCRGAVVSSIRGKRGQAFLREMVEALDAMPEKRLVAWELQKPSGEVCAIGSVGAKRGMDMAALDPEDALGVAGAFGVAEMLAREIVWENDEAGRHDETPEGRWLRMRAWAASNIKSDVLSSLQVGE